MAGADELPEPRSSYRPGCSLVRAEAGSSGGLVREHRPAGTHRGRPESGGPLVYTGNHEPNSPHPGDEDTEHAPISPKWRLQRTAKQILTGSKSLQKCHSTPRGAVEVWRSAERSTAAYRGLCTCQSVWCCPVCSAKIAARRAQELTDAIATHRANGGTVYLLTFTASHSRSDLLPDLVSAHMSAHARFWRQGGVRRTLEGLGVVGRVTAFEVTFGHDTGWHPHRHALVFVEQDDEHTAFELFDCLSDEWVRCCASSGLHATREHGLDVRGGEAAGAYVAKLGLEVALAVRKVGRRSRFGIWQLLEQAQNPWARAAFAAFAHAMKGKRHLVWSRGLKARLGVEDVSDEEIMEDGGSEDEALLAVLSRSLWRGVYANEIRGELLQILGIGDLEEARTLLLAFGLDPAGLTSG